MKNTFIQSNSSIITHHRGDTLYTPIFINMGSYTRPVRYSLQPGDVLYFGLMEPNTFFEYSILKKHFDCMSPKNVMGDTLLILDPKDTEFLIPGTYYYEVKLQQHDEFGREYVSTIIPKTLFYIV